MIKPLDSGLVKMIVGSVSLGGLLLVLTGGTLAGFKENRGDHKDIRIEQVQGDKDVMVKVDKLEEVVHSIDKHIAVQIAIFDRMEKKM